MRLAFSSRTVSPDARASAATALSQELLPSPTLQRKQARQAQEVQEAARARQLAARAHAAARVRAREAARQQAVAAQKKRQADQAAAAAAEYTADLAAQHFDALFAKTRVARASARGARRRPVERRLSKEGRQLLASVAGGSACLAPKSEVPVVQVSMAQGRMADSH